MEIKVNKNSLRLSTKLYIYIYVRDFKKAVNLNILYITLTQTAKDFW